MKLHNLMIASMLIAIAAPALATVKVYDQDADNGTPGDQILYTTTQCPPVQANANTITGSFTLIDDGLGSVTMTSSDTVIATLRDLPNLTAVFGPGAFVFINAIGSGNIITIPVGSGDTSPGGTVTWGVVSGFTSTGLGFCIASPQTICTGGAMLAHGMTLPLDGVASPTYDLGTWSFDSEGDMEASSYIARTTNGGTSNNQRLLRGAYVGSSLPALPLIGAGALALGLVVAGSRSVLRKK